jgi:hypothetical protein
MATFTVTIELHNVPKSESTMVHTKLLKFMEARGYTRKNDVKLPRGEYEREAPSPASATVEQNVIKSFIATRLTPYSTGTVALGDRANWDLRPGKLG